VHNIEFYLDEAKKINGFKSDRELGNALGYKSTTISFIRKGRSFPSDDIMVELANMARQDIKTALIELNYWRSPEPARKTYASILQKIGGTAAAIALFAAVSLSFSPVANAADMSSKMTNTIYYGK
jgi:hypothetical protein